MAIFLALLTAVFYGTGDFSGGLASRRTSLINVVLWSHAIGLAGALLVAPFFAQPPAGADMAYGAVGGLFGLCGLVLLYRGLARGPMAVVAPLSAVSSAVVPLAWGLIDGERLSLLASAGLVLGLVSIVLVSAERKMVGRAPVHTSTVIESLLAGAGFGAFFVFLDLADDASAPWPIVGARTLTTALLIVVALRVKPTRPTGNTWWIIAAAGLFDGAANLSFLLATGEGDLTVVSVLASMYPAATVVLAWLVLREPIGRVQIIGLGVAGLAIAMVGFG